MKFLSRTTFTVLAAVAITMSAGSVKADSIQYTINNLDANPGYSGSFGTVTVDLVNSTTADITFSSGVAGGNIYLFIDSSSVDLNVNANSFSAGNFAGSNAGSGFSPWTLANSDPIGSGQVDGLGNFNLVVSAFDGFDHSADTVTFTLTDGDVGGWAAADDVLTANTTGYYLGAHIAVTTDPAVQANGAAFTGYAGANQPGVPPPTPVPDGGSTVLLLGAAMSGFALVRRKLS